MSDYIRDLGLDPEGREETVLTLAEAYHAYAATTTEYPAQVWRASSQVLAAVYFSLVDAARGRAAFAEASVTYRAMRKSFWVTLAVCGQQIDEPIYLRAANDSDQDASSAFAALLANSWVAGAHTADAQSDPRSKSAPLYSAIEHATHLRMSQVGRLGLPLDYYIQAAKESLEWTEEQPSLSAFAALLLRAVEPIEVARADRYHWQLLYTNVLPIEPEILAVCLGLARRWSSLQPSQPLRGLSERLAVPTVATVPLRLAIDMLQGPQRRRQRHRQR